MADEITVTISASLVNGTLKSTFAPGAKKINQATKGAQEGVWKVGTVDEALAITDVTTPSWCMLQNLDLVNFVEVGPASAGAIVKFIRLSAGESCIFRLAAAAALRGIANTAEVRLRYHIWDD